MLYQHDLKIQSTQLKIRMLPDPEDFATTAQFVTDEQLTTSSAVRIFGLTASNASLLGLEILIPDEGTPLKRDLVADVRGRTLGPVGQSV